MPFTSAMIIGGGAALGGLLGGSAAKSAAETSANAQLSAARMAANAQKFRPVGITSNFGTSNFQFDKNGYLTGAGYNLAPELQNVQSNLLGGTGQSLQDVANIQAMGRQYLSQSPQQAAQDWINSQQALLAPTREQAWANLGQSDYNRGTTGLKVAQGGGLSAANPYASALANSQALQDLTLASQAQQQGQQRYTFGQGLLTGAYSPLQTQLGTSQLVEQLGQSPLDIGAQLGGRSATAGANVGQSLLSGGMSAAQTMQKANSYSPLGSAISGAFSSPYLQQGLNNYFYQQPVQPGQFTPGSSAFMGPMPGSVNTGVSQWDANSQGF